MQRAAWTGWIVVEFAQLLKVIYPDQCVTCEALTDGAHGLCGPCWRKMGFLSGHRCTTCGVPLPGMGDGADDYCDECLAGPRNWLRGVSVFEYGGGAREFILKFKRGDRTELARPAGTWLATALRPHMTPKTVLVPVPAHPVRMISRRYNQAALLAGAAGRELSAATAMDALIRIRATPRLEGFSRVEREAKLKGAIRPHPKRGRTLQGKDVIIIDDVMTTGATLAVAAEAAWAAGADRVSVAVLARVVKPT